MTRDTSDTINVTVRLERDQANRMDEIVQDLEKLGLSDIERRVRFGMVNGSVKAERIEALRKVKGVASVREDQVYWTQ